jgi:hypothetical protein
MNKIFLINLKISAYYFILIILVILTLFPEKAKAQFGDPFGYGSNEIKRSHVRKMLNMFSVTATSGYGLTFYSHKLTDYTILNKPTGNPYLIRNYDEGGNNYGYNHWLQGTMPVEVEIEDSDDFLVHADSALLGYRGIGQSIPLNFSIHVDISRFRIGGGFMAEFHSIGNFNPTNYFEELRQYEPENRNVMFSRIYGIIGLKIHDYWDWSFVPELQFGKLNLGNSYNKAQIEKGLYANLGLSMEKNLSEYFRIIFKPIAEFKNYNLLMGEAGENILHKQPALFVTAGISLNYPEIPRCKIKACQTQLKHVHFGKEFRGQPLYKKQNPKYGENHPDLIKYKGRNKRIRSPF